MATDGHTDGGATPSSTPSVAWESPLLLLQEPLAGMVRSKAKKLARRYPFRPQDWQDIEQELLLKAVKVWSAINAAGGHPAAFLERVLRNQACNLRRHHGARCRRPHVKVVSLSHRHCNSRTGDAVELTDLVTRDEQQARLGINTPSELQRRETAHDVRQVISTLPPEAQVLLEAVMNATKAEVARRHKLRRSTLESRLRRLRPRFEGDQG